jgi:hypothetical protein
VCGFESLREHQEIKHILLQNITIVNNFTKEGKMELFKLIAGLFILAIVISLLLGWYHSTLIWM